MGQIWWAGIEAALKLKPIPNVVIALTDGYTPFPKHRYKIPVIFVQKIREDVPKPPIPPWKERDIVIIPIGQV